MASVHLRTGAETVTVELPDDLEVQVVEPAPVAASDDPLGLVAAALDRPIDAAPLVDAARNVRSAAIVVPDHTRPAPTRMLLLPILARLARAGLVPAQIAIVVARGIHTAAPRPHIEAALGADIMSELRPIQSAPNTPEMNEEIAVDTDIGSIRIHRAVARAELVVLTGAVAPHHLAGFGGGPKALVPGVAQAETVHAAHRLTLDALVRPDGSIRPLTGAMEGNRFRNALLRVARTFGRTWLCNVVLNAEGAIAAARAGDVQHAHEAAARCWTELHGLPEPAPADLVLVGTPAPRDVDLIQAHKSLLSAHGWAKPGAPIVWMARAPNGPGHPDFLPWFEAGKLPRHLASLREHFHPYGLTAYSIRRLAKQDHPVHVVSEVSRDILRPMGLLPFDDAQKAVAYALANNDVKTVAVLPAG